METIWTLGSATHRGLWLTTDRREDGWTWSVIDLHTPAPLAAGCCETWPDARDAAEAAARDLAPAHTARLVTAALTDGTSIHGALTEAGAL